MRMRFSYYLCGILTHLLLPPPPAPPPPAQDLQRCEPNTGEVRHKLTTVTNSAVAVLMSSQCPPTSSTNGQQATPATPATGGGGGGGHPLKDIADNDIVALLAQICDQSLFILVEWARGAHFFNELKVRVTINSYIYISFKYNYIYTYILIKLYII